MNYEKEKFSVTLRKELLDLIDKEMAKIRYIVARQRMVEVLLEDAMRARGYELPWLQELK